MLSPAAGATPAAESVASALSPAPPQAVVAPASARVRASAAAERGRWSTGEDMGGSGRNGAARGAPSRARADGNHTPAGPDVPAGGRRSGAFPGRRALPAPLGLHIAPRPGNMADRP